MNAPRLPGMDSMQAVNKRLALTEDIQARKAAVPKRRVSDQPAGPGGDSQPFVSPKRRKKTWRRTYKKDGSTVTEEMEGLHELDPSPYQKPANPPSGLSLPLESISPKLTNNPPLGFRSAADCLKDLENPTVSTLQHELGSAKARIDRLEADLEEQRRYNAQVEARVKQDMFLHIMQEKKLRQKAEENLEREKRINSKVITELKEAVEQSNSNTRQAQENTLRAIAQQKGLRTEIEHLQDLTTMLEGDLNELRDIQNEESTKRRNENNGLPPAYGDLDDENRFPPYSRHEDAGTLEVALFKRKARENFGIRIYNILRTADRMTMFKDLTCALAETCQSLQALLDVAPSITLTRSHRRGKGPNRPDALQTNTSVGRSSLAIQRLPEDCEPKILVHQLPGAPYVADRIARLIHDMIWHFVSVCDHGLDLPELPLEATAELRLKHKAIDTVLTAALKLAFRDKRPLPKLKYYVTQTLALRTHLLQVQRGFACQYFFNAVTWLDEQIECERELAARVLAVVDPYEPHEGDKSDDQSSGASSRWQDSDDEDDEEGHDTNGCHDSESDDDGSDSSDEAGDEEEEDGDDDGDDVFPPEYERGDERNPFIIDRNDLLSMTSDRRNRTFARWNDRN